MYKTRNSSADWTVGMDRYIYPLLFSFRYLTLVRCLGSCRWKKKKKKRMRRMNGESIVEMSWLIKWLWPEKMACRLLIPPGEGSSEPLERQSLFYLLFNLLKLMALHLLAPCSTIWASGTFGFIDFENAFFSLLVCSVFLVDHAWTYRVECARQQLLEIPGLLIRMASLMGLPFHGEAPDPDIVDLVLDNMWKYNQTYQLSQGVREGENSIKGKIHPKINICFTHYNLLKFTRCQATQDVN